MNDQEILPPISYNFYDLDSNEDITFDENNVFEEAFFAYLWDRIGEGTVGKYTNFLNYLIKKEYITDQKKEDSTDKKKKTVQTQRIFSITEEGYEKLKIILKKRLKKNSKVIYYLIFHYYLKLVKARIYNFVHRKEGYGIEELDCILDKDIKRLKNIQINLLNDNSGELVEVLEIKVKYLKAVMYSCEGNHKCIEIYGDIIKRTKGKEKIYPIELLSLGYLAHELMFVNIDKALDFGEKAYTLTKCINNNNLKMKNTCNYIKILLYSGKKEKLNEVIEFFNNILSTKKTERTNGRIKLQLALIAITEKKYDEARELLEYYDEENEDSRRYAISLAYKGLFYYIKNQDKGKRQLLKAIEKHKNEKDYRHLIFGILIYIWMVNNNFNGDISKINEYDYPDIEKFFNYLKNDKHKHFVEFWKNHFYRHILSKIELQ